jgi:hypothetical protein
VRAVPRAFGMSAIDWLARLVMFLERQRRIHPG